jgi:hypothetical protein
MLKQIRLKREWVWLCMVLPAVLLAAGALPAADEAGILSKQELKNLISNAKTAADHTRLAKHFAAKAVQLEADAKEHEELAAQYKANPNIHEMKHPGSAQTAGHCEFFGKSLRKAATDAKKLASDHELMAKGAAK